MRRTAFRAPSPPVPPVPPPGELPAATAARRSASRWLSASDLDAVARQLGREPRGVLEIAYRCPNGEPGVVKTAPRLPDGTPFPTLYYLTHPALTAAASRLESSGLMREMTERLADDPELAAAYRRAHESYLAERDAIESLGTTFSGGGMPDRVKCLHVVIAHSLAKGPGVNPFGDEALAVLAVEPGDGGNPGQGGVDDVRVGCDRLRDQLDPAADRRRGRRAGCATCTARCASCDSARVSMPRAQFAPEAIARTRAALTDYAELLRRHEVSNGADGGDVGDPRRRQPRRVLRDDRRGARRGRARRGRRGDHRRRGGRAVVPRCRRRIGLRRSAFRGRRPRWRVHRGGAGRRATVRRELSRPTSAASG